MHFQNLYTHSIKQSCKILTIYLLQLTVKCMDASGPNHIM